MYVCIYVCILCVYVCMCACMHVCVCVCPYVCMCVSVCLAVVYYSKLYIPRYYFIATMCVNLIKFLFSQRCTFLCSSVSYIYSKLYYPKTLGYLVTGYTIPVDVFIKISQYFIQETKKNIKKKTPHKKP